MKARKEDVELVGKSQMLSDHPPKQLPETELLLALVPSSAV